VFVPDYDEWLRRGMNNQINANGEWMLSQGSIHIRPIVPAGTHIAFGYLDKNCIKLNSGGVGDRFMDDADSFVLDERLLKLGMTWQWKANKGTSYAEDMGTYSDALAVAMGHDSPAPIIMGRRPISANVRTSYPWSVPT
jgi:hypothetical protein